MTIAIIINKKSGGGEKDDVIPKILKGFQERSITAKIHQLEGSAIPQVIKDAIRSGVDAIVVGGADGTINCVASELVGSSIPMGILPMGTFNHFAGDLKLPENLEDCIEIVAQRNTELVDVAEVNGRIFINNSSIGVYPLAVRLRENYQKKLGWTKRWAMIRSALNIFARFPVFTVKLETDAGTYFRRTSFVFVGNNKYTSGKREKITDGHCGATAAGRWLHFLDDPEFRAQALAVTLVFGAVKFKSSHRSDGRQSLAAKS